MNLKNILFSLLFASSLMVHADVRYGSFGLENGDIDVDGDGFDVSAYQLSFLLSSGNVIFSTGVASGTVDDVYGIIVYRGSYFGLYDTGKGALLTKDSSFIFKFIVAQVATNAAGVLSYPFDTVRRRLMMNSGAGKKLYSGTVDAFVKIYAITSY